MLLWHLAVNDFCTISQEAHNRRRGLLSPLLGSDVEIMLHRACDDPNLLLIKIVCIILALIREF
jgi:hypothetical protein